VSVSVAFHRIHPWALPPRKHTVDRSQGRTDAGVYQESFRYVRSERRAEHCPPWVMGQELGWRIHSPVDVTLTPLPQTEVAADAEPQEVARITGQSEVWGREKSQLAVGRTNWLHLFQFRTEQGWENMFLPNGQGSVEWRLGWSAEIPRGYFLLVLPSEQGPEGLEIPTGILSSTVATRMGKASGGGIAVRPGAPVSLRRGQEIARLVLLHADSLQAATSYPTAELTENA
jgi:hypothetical protein